MYGENNAYTAEFWEYDPRLARRWNVDPVDQISISNYATFGNVPTKFTDPKGDCFPCAVLIMTIGLSLTPEIGFTPTGNAESDGIAYQKAKEYRSNWIRNTMLLGFAPGLAAHPPCRHYCWVYWRVN